MKYSVCIELTKKIYNINRIDKEDVEIIAAAFEDRLESFFFSGTEYVIKDVKKFKVFAYENPEDYHTRINGNELVKNEGYFFENRVYFKADSLSRLFSDVTNDFIRKFSTDRNQAKTVFYPYVNKLRIDELTLLSNNNFDLRRLIKLCDEINHTFNNKCYISTIILVRAVLDHIPPIFVKKTFTEVANNYGGKSFKETMLHLDNSSRKIADLYLHTQISNKEDVPLEQQVNFSQSLDLLLSEIIKSLK